MSERAITSVAILKVNWDKGKDYIDNFVPFLAECLRKTVHPEVSLAELQQCFVTSFGLKIPQGALKTILNRAARQGYVQKTQGIYKKNDSKLEGIDLTSVRADVLRKHEALLGKLVRFCDSEHNVKLSAQEADASLIAYLQERSTPVLAAALDGQAIIASSAPTRNNDFLVNAFIRKLNESDPEGMDFLETIVKGSMLANAMVFPDLGSIDRRFNKVEIYFDTNFLLRALGTAGEAIKVSCIELLELLYEQNADLKCFEHTFDEMRGVLHAAANALRRPDGIRGNYGETIEYFIRQRSQPSDVEFEIARLEKKLNGLRVRIKPRPPQTDPLAVNEVMLETVLKKEVGYQRPDALRNDVDSLTAIYRLRAGRFPVHIESCDALFITTNPSLAKAGVVYFREGEGKAFTGSVPICLTDSVLTTLLWLKKPLDVGDLPRKRIIADCYAALNPSDSLWKRFLQEIDRLEKQGDITEDDYHLLRLSMEARSALVNITLGDVSAFSEGTIEEVLEKAKASARAKTEESLRDERAKRHDAEQKAGETQGKLDVYRQSQQDKFSYISVMVGYFAARALLACFVGVVILGTYQSLPEPFPDIKGEIVSFLLPGCLGLIAVLSIANLWFGTTLITLTKNLEVWIARQVYGKLDESLGMSLVDRRM